MMPGWERYASDPKVKARREAQQRAAAELRAEGVAPSAKAIEQRRLETMGGGSLDVKMNMPSSFQYYPQFFNSSGYWIDECPPPKPLALEETIITTITGWRRWTVEMFGNVLRSNNGVKWGAGEKLVAECKPGIGIFAWGLSRAGSSCQGIHCTCGIYAYKSQSLIETGENAPAGLLQVYGEVYLWGRVVEHERGYRGQYAYPKAFMDTGGISRQLAREYGVGLIQMGEK